MSGIDPFEQPEDLIRRVGEFQVSPLPPGEPAPVVHSFTPLPPTLPLHPNFWWAVLWCIGLVLFTQVPGGIVLFVILLAASLLSPSTLTPEKMADGEALLKHPIGQIGLAASIFVSFVLMILFSLLVLRIVAGRDWRRQIALRLPSFSHFMLVLVVAPAFVVFGSGVDQLLANFVHLPSVGTDLPGAAAFLTVATADLSALALAALLVHIVRIPLRMPFAGQLVLAAFLVAVAVQPNLWAYANLREYFQAGFLGRIHMSGIQQMEQVFTDWPVALAVLAIGVMPGLGEELWCRGFLGRGLVGKHGLLWGVLGTSFLFGALHVDPRQGTMAMFAGIMLHYVYLTTRSLLLPMLLHFLNNSMAVTLTRIPELRKLDTVAETQPHLLIALLSGAVVLVVGVCWSLYQSRARLINDGTGPGWQPHSPGVALPPPGSGTRVETPPLSQVSLALLAAGLAAFAAGVAISMHRIG
jgi:membrane protease YdiL (CAAX protease family)